MRKARRGGEQVWLHSSHVRCTGSAMRPIVQEAMTCSDMQPGCWERGCRFQCHRYAVKLLSVGRITFAYTKVVNTCTVAISVMLVQTDHQISPEGRCLATLSLCTG